MSILLVMIILLFNPLIFAQEHPENTMQPEQEIVQHEMENVEPDKGEAIEPEKAETVESAEWQPETTEAADKVDTSAPQDAAAIELPAIPEPVADEEVTVPEVEETPEEPKGIDTVSLEDSQGNWLFKRIWWERAEDRYGKIRGLVDKIWESRTAFFIKRNELDRKVLDPFYLSIGVGQGELQVILSELNDFFEKEREKQGDLNDHERELFETLTVEQENLKQLKLDVESIASLDHAIDDALSMLMDQINHVRQLEKKAWENFKEIAHILNDVKARELYYMIEGAGRNIKNISNYIENSFLSHFTKLIDQAQKHVARVRQQIEALKEKGVDFKRQADRVAEQDKLEKQRQAEQLAEQEEEELQPKPKKGWIEWLMSGPQYVWNMIVSLVLLPYNMIFGGRQ